MQPESFTTLVIKLGVAFLLVLANGFFVAAEFALVGVRRSRVLTLIEAGNKRAATLLRVISMLDAYLSASQFGITLASLGLGWLGESTLARAFTPLFAQILPAGIAADAAAHTLAVVIAFSLITFLHIVMGELAPKTLALEKTEAVALLVARPMEVFYSLFRLPIWLLNQSGTLLIRLFGLHLRAEQTHSYTKEELRQLVEMSHQGGHIQSEELTMLNNIIEFAETEIREVMVPRTEIHALSDKASLDEIYNEFRLSGYSRLPVYSEQLDNIIGILFVKDIFPYLREPAGFSIAKLLNRPLYLPETARLVEALRQMRRAGVHMGIVVDEHGGTLGIVTLEDLLEEIVGEIRDEHDEEDVDWVKQIRPGHYALAGGATIRAINRRLKLGLPEEENYTTLAGFMMNRAGKVLKVGESVNFGQMKFTVAKTEKFRIIEVELELPQPLSSRSSPDRTER